MTEESNLIDPEDQFEEGFYRFESCGRVAYTKYENGDMKLLCYRFVDSDEWKAGGNMPVYKWSDKVEFIRLEEGSDELTDVHLANF